MDSIYTCDAAVILLSPAYKKRVDAREKGVYEEYQRIMDRLNELEQLRRKSGKTRQDILLIRQSSFSVFPYIFQGSGESSCPTGLSNHKYESLSNWNVFRSQQGDYYVSDSIKKQYRNEFAQIISHIIDNHFTKAPSYSETYEHIFHHLFRTVKQEDVKGFLDKNPEIAERLFVKTQAYQEVKAQRAYILTGRKGTGKTTLTDNLARIHKNFYKEHFPIKLDDFELEAIVGMLSIPQIASDISFIIRRERVFRIAWMLFIYVHCMEILIIERKNRGLKPNQEKAAPYIEKFIADKFMYDTSKSPLRKAAVYMWALHQIIEYINNCIANSRTQDQAIFFYDLNESIADENILENIISKEVLFPFFNILRECTKRFLISLDGFDRNFDDFRRKAKASGRKEHDIQQIVSLEKDWVRSLLYLCRVIKRDRDKWGLYPLVDFCVTVPKDRCIEIMRDERDSVAYLGRICEIKWSGIELAIMLRKRLEITYTHQTNPEDRPIQRLDEVVSIGLDKLPEKGLTRIGSRSIQLPLFLDVLRHTFWRPRDILMYYTSIITTYEHLTKHNIEVDYDILNKKISDTTYDVIDREFIGEFQSSLRNIDKVIKSFKGVKQILKVHEVETLLSQIEFDFSDSLQSVKDVKSKARFLFEIGFLGLRCPQNIRDRFKLLLDDIFYFNDSGKLEKMIEDDTWLACDILIHPIFCEYLDLDIKNQNDIILKYTWPYIEKQDVIDQFQSFL
jgi:energy-coupling factor transporter ATP-binding protein EcfA2